MSTDIDPPVAPDVPKRRLCLRCRTPFESAWAGERVCNGCKGTSTWKRGESLRSVPSRPGTSSGRSGGAE